MSRVSKKPIVIPAGVEVYIGDKNVEVKGSKGVLKYSFDDDVHIVKEDKLVKFIVIDGITNSEALAGTARALVKNMIEGVSNGFMRKLQLIGVGYRAQAQGRFIHLTLGFSHPVKHELPPGITAETPSQTEIIIRGADKQLVGQVAAQIRGYRSPEPYKGKGIRYEGEVIIQKEGKKK